YQERVKNFDFDMTTRRFTMSETPGVELESYFSSKVAEMAGSFNLAGLKSQGIDALVGQVMQAKNRTDLNVAISALDRGLRAYYLWVPHWFKGAHNVAHWDIFGKPTTKPKFSRGILDTWWIDAAKAASIRRGA
ncbi:MAG: ABC transporter substrate-binding protein, partial [Burkholderiaceae bacterium]